MIRTCPRCGSELKGIVFSLRGYCSKPCYLADKNDGTRMGGDPTPEEIAEMTAAIRATWSEKEHRRRAFIRKHGPADGEGKDVQQWTLPEVGPLSQRSDPND